jgi:hypothetical protein
VAGNGPEGQPHVKGSAIASRALWVSLHHGDEGLKRLIAEVKPATREALERPIDKARWYGFDVFVDLNESIDRVFGSGDLALVKTLGRFGAEANLKTIYRLFYMVGTVKWVLDRAARLWDLHYDSGRFLIIRRPGNELEARIVRFATPHRTHCLSVAGWAERSVELSGGKDVKMIETACRARGDDDCSFEVTWR